MDFDTPVLIAHAKRQWQIYHWVRKESE